MITLPNNATRSHRRYIEALNNNGWNYKKAANELGVNYKTLTKEITVMRRKYGIEISYDRKIKKASLQDDSGLTVKGVSTLFDADGNPIMEWVKKSKEDTTLIDGIKAALEEFKNLDLHVPPSGVTKAYTGNQLLGQLTIADYHLGMFAHEEESGEEWNFDKSVDALKAFIDQMVGLMPPCHTGVLTILGDFLHSDSEYPITPAHKNILDQDTRYYRMIRYAIHAIHYGIEKLREKCNEVKVVIAQGNHDPVGSLWLSESFAFYYNGQEDVQIVHSPSPFYCIEFQNTMLVYHHGHKVAFEKIGQIIPAMFPEAWGRTKYRYVHLGHRHHKHIKEQYGLTVEQHQTLAPKDAYAASHGYIAERGANVIIYSAEVGEMSRCTVRPEIFKYNKT